MLAMTYEQTCYLKVFALFIVFFALMYIAACIRDYKERKREKQELREYRHFYDLDKQQETDDIEKLYNETILNEIWNDFNK